MSDSSSSFVAGEMLVLAGRRLDALNCVEVAVFADERGAEGSDQPARLTAGGQERGGELPRVVDPLLPVEQSRELGQEVLRLGTGLGRR